MQKKEAVPKNDSFFPMSWTARKQGPEGPTPASHGHSSTFVRVCQAPVFDSVAGSHGTRLLGASWLPWRVFPRSVGAPAPTLDHLRPAPSCRYRAEPKGEENTEAAPHQPRAPPPPSGGRGRGGKGERPGQIPQQRKRHTAPQCRAAVGGQGNGAGDRAGRQPSQERAKPPHRRPALTARRVQA